jgi:lipopolysaccharide biosynthesis glycosyltransferase
MNLIYMCVFYQQRYIDLLELLISSISVKGNIDKETTDILIITSAQFQPLIHAILEDFNLPIQYYILDIYTPLHAACARLHIFSYDKINKYDTILYLDTDILINSDINKLFSLTLSSEKLYALEEGNIGCEYWGGQFFDFTKFDRNDTAFSSGILLFKNSQDIKSLFHRTNIHITTYTNNEIAGNDNIFGDQPFIVYNAISQNKYDNKLLTTYVENNPSIVSPTKVVYHFPGSPGAYIIKHFIMNNFWEKILLAS